MDSRRPTFDGLLSSQLLVVQLDLRLQSWLAACSKYIQDYSFQIPNSQSTTALGLTKRHALRVSATMAATPSFAFSSGDDPLLQPTTSTDSPSFQVEVPVRLPPYSFQSAKLTASLALQPANLIHAEILSVTSAMRKNQRWAASSSSSYSSYSQSNSSRPNGIGRRESNAKLHAAAAARGQLQGAQGLMGGFVQLKMELREIEGESCLRRVETGLR